MVRSRCPQGFEWIAELLPKSFGRLPDDDTFFSLAREVGRRLSTSAALPALERLFADCLADPASLHRWTSERDIFADLSLALLRAEDDGDARVDLNLWRRGRATSIHNHCFSALTWCLSGACEEIVFAPLGEPDLSLGIPVPPLIEPRAVKTWDAGRSFRVYQARSERVGTIHSVLHAEPVTVALVVRAGASGNGQNHAWSSDTFRRLDRTSAHLERDVSVLALACGSLGLRGALDAAALRGWPQILDEARGLLASRHAAADALPDEDHSLRLNVMPLRRQAAPSASSE
jgi:hypothetical protein